MNPAFEHALNIRCAALFNALFNNEHNVQVSDTTKDAIYTIADLIKHY